MGKAAAHDVSKHTRLRFVDMSRTGIGDAPPGEEFAYGSYCGVFVRARAVVWKGEPATVVDWIEVGEPEEAEVQG